MADRGRERQPIDLTLQLVVFALVLLSSRLLVMIERYSVNLLFWDQWDFMRPVMGGAGAWELFRTQHGPHRQGIAFLLTVAIDRATGWNTRAEAMMIGLLVCAAAALAVLLQYRLRGRLAWSDVAIPLVVLTPAQYGIFIHTPNASHGAGPLLLLVMYCLASTMRGRRRRYVALLGLNFCLVFTGFGMFAGVLTPLYFGLEALRGLRGGDRARLREALLGVLLALLSGAAFFVGWRFDPALPGFRLGPQQLAAVPHFVALMFANVLGLKGTGPVPTLAGSLFGAAALVIAVRRARALLRGVGDPAGRAETAADEVICILVFFSLLFCVDVALGRVTLGLSSAQSSRYVPLVVPAFLGVLLHAAAWCERLAPTRGVAVRAALVAGMIAATFPMRAGEYAFMRSLAIRKAKWAETYRATHDMAAADRAARIEIRTPQQDPERIRAELDWLEERHLNLFDRQ